MHSPLTTHWSAVKGVFYAFLKALFIMVFTLGKGTLLLWPTFIRIGLMTLMIVGPHFGMRCILDLA